MRPMVLVYAHLHDWVILDKGKCWDSYSSTMGHIWAIRKKHQRRCVVLPASRTAMAAQNCETRWFFVLIPSGYD